MKHSSPYCNSRFAILSLGLSQSLKLCGVSTNSLRRLNSAVVYKQLTRGVINLKIRLYNALSVEQIAYRINGRASQLFFGRLGICPLNAELSLLSFSQSQCLIRRLRLDCIRFVSVASRQPYKVRTRRLIRLISYAQHYSVGGITHSWHIVGI